MAETKKLIWPKHAVLAPPSREQVLAAAAARGVAPEELMRDLIGQVHRAIAAEEADPLHCGWEPSIWMVCRALLGIEECYSATFLAHILERFNMDWKTWAGTMREVLGFKHTVRMLLIMGGNRSSKSNFAAKLGMETMEHEANARVFPMHMSNPRSVRDQQPLFWRYMPGEWRHQSKSTLEYIAYKQKTGFSDSSFIAPNGAECAFLNYQQDRDTALEGIEANLVLPDELIPVDWLETLPMRLVTRAGRAVVTFTPVNGYTPSVKIFCDSARVAKDALAHLLPTDGAGRAEHLALNLTEKEYEEVVAAHYEKRNAHVPQSRPDDCHAWLEEAGVKTTGRGGPYGYGHAQMPAPAGRTFERMPRVLGSTDPRKAVVFFWSHDNPYGNPKEVVAETRAKSVGWARERFYGLAERIARSKFTKFSETEHVLAPAEIPLGGTNYMLCDPHGSRNYFMGWIRIIKQNVYVYREWPGPFHVPGIGVPGPWAIPSGKKEGQNDGAAGEGQTSFGFGLLRYKYEIARLEGWKDWREWTTDHGPRTTDTEDCVPEREELEEWTENGGAEEQIELRIMDSRAASAPKVEDDRPVTLQTEFDDLLLCFDLAPGKDVATGEGLINAALDYEKRAGIGDEKSFTANGREGTRREGEEVTTKHAEGAKGEVDGDGEKSFTTKDTKGNEGGGGERKKCEDIACNSVARRCTEEGYVMRPRLFISRDCPNFIYALQNYLGTDGDKGACKEPIDILRWFFTGDYEDLGRGGPARRGGTSYGTRSQGTGARVQGKGRLDQWTRDGRARFR